MKRFLVLFILITGCDFTKEPYPHKIFPKELKGIWITKTDTSIYNMVFLDSNHVMVSTFGNTIMSYKILPKTNYSLFNLTQMSGRDSIASILCSVFWSDKKRISMKIKQIKYFTPLPWQRKDSRVLIWESEK
ncbi:MAG TPA: hypothetical protein VNW06_01270 [Cytophagaceae bacterium]|nr:hypothetical protein [Cytophagaceae bacterium]